MYDVGDIVAIKFKCPDLAQEQLRPVLILNRYQNDYIVAFITSKMSPYREEETSYVIDNNSLSTGTLKKEALIKKRSFASV